MPKSLSSSWTFELDYLTQAGLRSREAIDSSNPNGLPNHLFLQHKNKYGFMPVVPSLALSQRIQTAIIDGWLAWAGTSKRLLDDPVRLEALGKWGIPPYEKSGIDLSAKSKVRVEGCYIGGRFNSMAATTAWLELPESVTSNTTS